MTRSELVNELAEQADISPKESDRLIRTLFGILRDSLATGEKITISGFGTFERRKRKATVVRNPKTGEPMPVAEQHVAAFRAGSALKEAIRSQPDYPASQSSASAI